MNAVRGRIGPLLTTGVALSVAAVVVANPVVAPRADVAIPAVKVKLSGTGDPLDMLDAEFLSAIGPAPTEPSNNPFAVLRDLIATLAADATYIGRNAILGAFFAGATAVTTTPELTAASHPYLPPASAPVGPTPVGPVAWPAPDGWTTPMPVSTEQLMAIAAIPAELVPAAAEVVMTLMDDVRGIGDTAVTAAFAAGALLVSGGVHVIDAVRSLAVGDVDGALTNLLTVVSVDDAQKVIDDAITNMTIVAAGSRSPAPLPIELAESPSAAEESTESLTSPSAVDAVGPERVQRRKPVTPEQAPVPSVPNSVPSVTDPVPSVTGPVPSVPDAEDTTVETTLPEAGKPEADAAAPVRTRVRSGPLKDAVDGVRKQTQGILRDAADSVQTASEAAHKASEAAQKASDSMKKAADRAAKPDNGPTGG